ncbi:MAG: ferritin-like domain-containing protein [Bacillota bacterium]
MEKEKLLAKLNWFYNLELSQVDLYTAQSKSLNDQEICVAFERIAIIEQQHVDNIANAIHELGGQPSKIGDVVAPIVGNVTGRILSLSGVEHVLNINILLEQRAMEDYRNLINDLSNTRYPGHLIKTLQYNLLDEGLHAAWSKEKLGVYGEKEKQT